MVKYTSEEAIKRREAGLTDRMAPQEFVRLCQQGEGEFMTINLSGAELGGITVKDGATLYGSNLSGANLSKAILTNCTLNDTDLSGADLREADLRKSYFHDANLRNANLSGANLSEAHFSRADLQGAVLAGANLEKAELTEANLSGADLRDTKLDGAGFKWADLSKANLGETDLSGVDLAGATMPDGLRSGTVIEAEAVSLDEARAQVRRQIPEGSLLVAEKVVSDGQPVIRSRQTIEVEAHSLEEARSKAKAQLSEGFQVLSENIASGAKPETVRGTAGSTAAAFEKAQKGIPGDASILERKIIKSPGRSVIVVEAPDEFSARSSAQVQAVPQHGRSATLGNVRMIKAGSKGLLGFGAKPNQYEVEIISPAVVEITYQPIVELSCEIGIVDRPTAKVTARMATIEQELRLLQEVLVRGGMSGTPLLLQKGMTMAKNVLIQSPSYQMGVVIPFIHSDLMIRGAIDGMISSEDYTMALSTLDAYHSFLSALASQVKGSHSDLVEFCAGMLGQTLTSRYGNIGNETVRSKQVKRLSSVQNKALSFCRMNKMSGMPHVLIVSWLPCTATIRTGGKRSPILNGQWNLIRNMATPGGFSVLLMRSQEILTEVWNAACEPLNWAMSRPLK